MNISWETLIRLHDQFSGIADKNKSTYELISQHGKHIVNIGEYVEVWMYGDYCFIFEDNEIITGFLHDDQENYKLMEHACLFYHKNVSLKKVKH